MQTQPLRPPTATLVAVEVALPPLHAPGTEAPAVPDAAPSTPGFTRHSLGVIEADRDGRLRRRGFRGRRHRAEDARAHPRLGAALEAERSARA